MARVIDLTNLMAAQGFVIQGDAANNLAGRSVASAGDVNGDGLADLIVGAPDGDDGGYKAGEAYVIFGSRDGFGGRIDLSAMTAAQGFVIQGDAARDEAGVSVASAGDVNGDGLADLIVGAPYGDDGGDGAGEAYVVFGVPDGSSGRIDLSILTAAQGFVIQGDAAGDQAGKSVASVGDVNGDGLADLIVGAPYGDDGGANAGEAYVVFGSRDGFGVDVNGRHVIDLSALTATQGFVIQGDAPYDATGWSGASAGDVNGDGLADLIVSAIVGDDGGLNTGEAYVVFGSRDGFGGRLDLTALTAAQGFVIQGDATDDRVGASVASAGDVNGDGVDDLIVGAPYGDDGGSNAGEAYEVFGSRDGFDGPIDLSALTAAQGFVIQGDHAGDIAGLSAAAAGDVNGDGLSDLIVGAPLGDDGGDDAGEAYVVFGSRDGFAGRIDLTALTAAQGFVIQGDAAEDGMGVSVAPAGDVNGDGVDDLIVGAPYGDDGGSNAGEAYVIFGRREVITAEDTPVSIAIPRADSAVITAVSQGTHGAVVIHDNGTPDPGDDTITYTPGADYAGEDSFTYEVTTGGVTATHTHYVTVSPVNDAPVNTVPGTQTVGENGVLNLHGVSVADVDAGAAAIEVTLTATNGVLSLNDTTGLSFLVGDGAGDGAMTFSGAIAAINQALTGLTFTPTADYAGPAAVQITTNDKGASGAGGAFTDTDTIAIIVNDPPIAVAETLTVAEDHVATTLDGGATTVLANDTDENDDDLTAILVSGPAHGALTLNTDGSFSYTPNANYHGTDSFTYKANDGAIDSGNVTVQILVTPVNDAPVVDHAIVNQSIAEDTSWSFVVPANTFSDVDGDTLTYTATLASGAALPGWLAFDAATRTFTGAPPANYNGVLALKVTADDGNGGAVSDVFDLTVTPVNDAPVVDHAIADQSIAEDTSWSFVIPANTFSDVDGDALTYTSTLASGAALPGWLSFDAATRTFTGAPPANYNGVLALKVTADDGNGGAVSDGFDLTVTPVNDAPVVDHAIADQSIAEDTSWSFVVPANTFSDVDGDALTYTATLASGAALPVWLAFDAATRTFTGAPPVNYNGVLALKVTADDGNGGAVSDGFDLTVTPVNDAPVVDHAIADQSIAEDTSWSFVVPANTFSDADGDTLTYTATLGDDSALPGWLAFDAATRTFTGAPPANYNGVLTLKVTADDGNGGAVSDMFDLTVTPVNDAPTAPATGSAIAYGPNPTSATPIGASDVDGDALVYSVKPGAGPAHGSVSFADGAYVYTPSANVDGDDTFTILIDDGHGGLAEQTVAIVIHALLPDNAPPVLAASQALTTLAGTGVRFTVAAQDPDGDPIAYTPSDPAHGAVTLENGQYVYRPDAGFTGADHFTVTASDGRGGVASQTITVTVGDMPDASNWRLFAADGFAGSIGNAGANGAGTVIGSAADQAITVLDTAGLVTFDASFNRGGDSVRLSGDAADWQVMRSGSNAVLSDGDTFVSIPAGATGMAVLFDDGARTLIISDTLRLGGQAVDGVFTRLAAPAGAAGPAPDLSDEASSRIFIDEGPGAVLGGDYTVIGSPAADTVTALFGEIRLDTSFNRGGDTLVLAADPASLSAVRSSTSIVELTGDDLRVVIPLGTAGLTIAFAGGDERMLHYDPGLGAALLGAQTIGPDSVALLG